MVKLNLGEKISQNQRLNDTDLIFGKKLTDSKNLIYDLSIGLIKEPSIIDNLLNTIPGVVENGLFVDMANIVILGEENGVKIIEK